MARSCVLEKSAQHIYWKNVPANAKLVFQNRTFYCGGRMVYWESEKNEIVIPWLTKKTENLTSVQ